MERRGVTEVVVLALVLSLLLGWNLYRSEVEPRPDEVPASTTPLPEQGSTVPGRVAPFTPTGPPPTPAPATVGP